ncbi:TM2 domain-containing protein [Marinobacter sp. M216]|uniref:TM2 domain-containing protein n=1 Tax=Marinobacter albus TaxID=3030833 RepID=A0ABT7H939_9GAMM|nr:TM2 domain-containing protein [Marinobacter sp. M216]MDK9556861.1 TM2 domain-containing protein [Marinobacter sp. M216]
MLKQEEVDAEEDSLRKAIRELSEEQRAEFYRQAGKAVKDPDTYAALNWFFITGLHHFYLGRWQSGLIDIGALLFAIGCFAAGFVWPGVILLLIVYSWELWQLFRSQIIVQNWNNRLYRDLLSRYQHRRYLG